MEEVATGYLERYASKKKSAKLIRRYIERDVLPVWGERKAIDIKRRDVEELVELKAKNTPIAGNMLLSIVRGAGCSRAGTPKGI